MTIRTSILTVIFLFLTILCCATSASALRGSGIGFTENKGQVVDAEGNLRSDILYTGDGADMFVFIRNTGISYVLTKTDEIAEDAWGNEELINKINYYTHRIDLDFIGCNTNIITERKDEVEGYKNYYYPHCPEGITHVKSYNTLVQKNVYNNIDVVYKGNKTQGLKYDVIVNPGGNVNDIKIKYNGAGNIILENGKLKIETSLGNLIEYMPRVYQNINGKIVDVECRYEILDMRYERKNTSSQYLSRKLSGLNTYILSFKLGTFNPEYSLIIDPWVTYFGGSGTDNGHSITTDVNGDVIFTGYTGSINFPVLGAQQASFAGLGDMFIAKMNAAGALLWSTYYGGTLQESGGMGICTDRNNGSIYVSGSTPSADFPIGTPAAGQTNFISTHPGRPSAFLVKLNPAGTRLWATFYGDNSGTTNGLDVTVDQNNDVILGGETYATNNIATAGTFGQTNNGGGDGYVAKFNSSGNRLWASYCGGGNGEEVAGVSCDAANNIYLGGFTGSNDFPTTPGVHQVNKRNSSDGFLFKFNSAGQRVWGTYYGGGGSEQVYAVQIDLNGDVYIGGKTSSGNNIATPGSFQPGKSSGASFDAFLAKLSSAGTLLWGTYLGGDTYQGNPNSISALEYIVALAVDNHNNIIAAGDTYSNDFPVTSCSYQTVFLGTEDQFITSFDSNGNLQCSGFMGTGVGSTENNETANGGAGNCIAVSGDYVYLIAFTRCNYPVTANAYQTACTNTTDAVISKLCISSCGLSAIAADFTANTNICSGQPVNFLLQNTSCSQANTTYQWTFTGAATVSSTGHNPTNIIYPTPGIYSVKVVIETPCGKDSVIKNSFIHVNSPSVTVVNTTPVTCNGLSDGTATVTGSAGYSYSWSNAQTAATATALSAGIYTVVVNDALSCSASLSVVITQPPVVSINNFSVGDVLCNGNNDGWMLVNPVGGNGNYTYVWNNGAVTPGISNLVAGTYSVMITDGNGCTANGAFQVTEPPLLTITTLSPSPVCSGQSAGLSAIAGGGSPNYFYSWNTGHNTPVINQQPNITTDYTVTITDNNSCTASASILLTVYPVPEIAFIADTTEGCNPLCVNFTNTVANVQSQSWDFGNGATGNQQNETYCYSSPGTYSVAITITDNNGCTNTLVKNNFITIHPIPVASFSINPNPAEINTAVQFFDQSAGATSWLWNFGDAVNSYSTTQHPVFVYTDSGRYQVQLIVQATAGCADTAWQELTIKPEYSFYVPNSFTPNGDNVNDVFIPSAAGISNEGFEFYIYDRWGNLIWQTKKWGEGWDGRANGGNNISQVDTYVWKLSAKSLTGETIRRTGHINLIK